MKNKPGLQNYVTINPATDGVSGGVSVFAVSFLVCNHRYSFLRVRQVLADHAAVVTSRVDRVIIVGLLMS